MKTSNQGKVKRCEKKKVHKAKCIKRRKKAHYWWRDRGEGERELLLTTCKNSLKVISESCSKGSMSGLSVMQHGHVRVRRHPMQRREFSESGQPVPKMPRPTSLFSVKDQKYRPYSTSPSAFFRHMHVLHSTCHCLETVCTCTHTIHDI